MLFIVFLARTLERMKKDIEKEIKAVENILELLNRCLRIHFKHRQFFNAKATLIDIQVCKKELKKLQAAKQDEVKASKEQIQNALQ
jgi:hypothetical protein